MKSILALVLVSMTLCNSIINQKFVDQLKQINVPYEVYEPEENPFRDYTDEEIQNLLGTKILSVVPKHKKVYTKVNDGYDFREKHPECMLGVRNQLSCGSCWAFGGVTALQQRFCKKSGGNQKPMLAPQDPVSCDEANLACNGGILLLHWQYLEEVGVVEEECFPYSSGEGDVEDCITKCKNGAEWKKYKTDGFDNFDDADDIKSDVALNGPLETQFQVYADFMSYKGGIYEYKYGELRGGHAVTILGYGNENGVDYWICQNSWGPKWGEKGFFRIKMGEVGIDSNAFGGHPIL